MVTKFLKMRRVYIISMAIKVRKFIITLIIHQRECQEKIFKKKFIVYDDEEENSSDLDFDDFLKKFPEVKDNNLAGEVYSIMQEQGSFDDYDDEEIVSFMKAAATWTDAEDVADYFDEPASDLGRLIASYYQEESGYEDYDDQWDNYLDYLFDQTEREGDDIDDWRIPD